MQLLFSLARFAAQLALLYCAVSAAPASATLPCFAPTGDWITGADLAAVMPAFAGLPASLKVSYAPVPGLARVFHPDELRRLAREHGMPDPAPGSTQNICSAWPLAPLAPERLRHAMEEALAGRAPQIELLTQDKADAPAGEVVFPVAGLSAYSDGPVIWKGYVRYSETRRFETWARVRVRVSETHLRAQGAIHAGDRLLPGQWRAEAYSGPPLREQILSDGAQLEGLIARRDFADGAPLLALFFEIPKAVERGDLVTVVAGVGAAQIEAPGEALSAGRCGEVIPVRNPRSNRTFRARITSAGRVEVLPGTTVGLAGTDTTKGNPQ
jgi:flagella basal body P-ring formation protein FlgA